MARARDDGTSFDFVNLRLILAAICLRRSQTILHGKGHDIEHRRPRFSPSERSEYMALGEQYRRHLQLESGGTQGRNHPNRVGEALLRLRMFCNNGPRVLDISSNADTKRADEIFSMIQQRDQAICHSCTLEVTAVGRLDDHDTGFITACSILVCGECVSDFLETHRLECPSCSHLAESSQDQCVEAGLGQVSKPPTKIMELLHDVKRHYYLGQKW